MALLLLSVNRQQLVNDKSMILFLENKEIFSLKGISSPYTNRSIYVSFDVAESFAYPIVPKKQQISIKNETIILEYLEEHF